MTRAKPGLNKVIVVGLDGLDPKVTARMLDAGDLPNLARLRDRGGFVRLATTSPAQTPVAWSTFATGLNPGGHGIFDFVRRDPTTYLPDLALNRYARKNAFLPPKAVNLRGGTPLWSVLADAGVPSVVLRCPCTYPADEHPRLRMLSGLGTPDVRGGLGTPIFYSADPSARPGESENLVRLAVDSDNVQTHLIGPRDPRTRGDLSAPLTLQVDREGGRVFASAGSDKGVEAPLGGWSDWLAVEFRVGLFKSVRGVVRLHLKGLEPLEVYATAVHFDPADPPFPVSAPGGYAKELAETLGTFATAGMVEDHTGLNNGRLTEDAFLEHCDLAWRERERMMLHELNRFEEGFFFCLFDTPDRVQHMFWKDLDPGHPVHRGAPPRADRRVIDDHYRIADTMVGHALGHADDRTLVVALSDHGFNSFRRGVDLNAWLHDAGLLALKPGFEPGPGAGDYLRGVDWSRTRAYALGLTGIYLNLRGREGQGTVAPADAGGVKLAIARGLKGLTDPGNGAPAVRRVVPSSEAYCGPYAGDAPDLLVHFAGGYRVSWGASAGGVSASVFEDNLRAWGGDHLVDPALVPGVLFMNRPFRGEGSGLADLAPTVLEALGVPKSPGMEGESLLR